MNILIGKNEHFPKRIINREKELKLINTAINSLLSKNLLTTPIIDF